MRRELDPVLTLARTMPAEELPRLVGELAEINAVALARLTSPTITAKPDELLDVDQAAKRLHCSTDYLYRNHKRLPFSRPDKVGRRLLFSSAGLDAYLRKSR